MLAHTLYVKNYLYRVKDLVSTSMTISPMDQAGRSGDPKCTESGM